MELMSDDEIFHRFCLLCNAGKLTLDALYACTAKKRINIVGLQLQDVCRRISKSIL
jgi:hypothetical protein